MPTTCESPTYEFDENSSGGHYAFHYGQTDG